MRSFIFSNRFKKDYKLCQKQGRNLEKLQRVFSILLTGEPIPARYKDHPLKGNWKGYRDLHIEPDWVLIYKIQDDQIILLAATGSHAYTLSK